MSVTEFLGRRPKRILVPLGAGLFLLIWIGDHFAGPELEISIFYIIPVSFFSWFINRRAGLAAAIASAALLLAVYRTPPAYHLHRGIVYWNDLAWLSLYAFIVLIVSELNRLYTREKERSLTDDVTGIPNRRAFFECLTAEKNRARSDRSPMSVAYVDVDKFKSINDRLGHTAGDRLLACAAKAMRENIRQSDFVARMGGDEFAVLLPQTDMSAAGAVLGKMVKALDDAMQRHQWAVSFSIGTVTFCPPPDSVQEIVSQADAAMYSVKATGRSGVKQQQAPMTIKPPR